MKAHVCWTAGQVAVTLVGGGITDLMSSVRWRLAGGFPLFIVEEMAYAESLVPPGGPFPPRKPDPPRYSRKGAHHRLSRYHAAHRHHASPPRSEERRVGKECR